MTASSWAGVNSPVERRAQGVVGQADGALLLLLVALATERPFEVEPGDLQTAALSKFAAANNERFGEKAYIVWNLTKFLIDREGRLVERFELTIGMDRVERVVTALL